MSGYTLSFIVIVLSSSSSEENEKLFWLFLKSGDSGCFFVLRVRKKLRLKSLLFIAAVIATTFTVFPLVGNPDFQVCVGGPRCRTTATTSTSASTMTAVLYFYSSRKKTVSDWKILLVANGVNDENNSVAKTELIDLSNGKRCSRFQTLCITT